MIHQPTMYRENILMGVVAKADKKNSFTIVGIIFLFYNIGSMKDPLHKLQDNPLSLSLAWVQSSFHSLYFSIHKRRESVQCYNNYNAVGEWLLKPLYSLHKNHCKSPRKNLISPRLVFENCNVTVFEITFSWIRLLFEETRFQRNISQGYPIWSLHWRIKMKPDQQ